LTGQQSGVAPKTELEHRPATASAGGGVVKLTINVTAPIMDALRELSARHGTTVTEEVRRAVSVWKYLDDELRSGGKLLLEKEGSRVRELVFGPHLNK
jgi:hypothetical protein